TYLITVRATDNGSPVQSDAKSFHVTVQVPPPLAFTAAQMNPNNTITLFWGTQPQKTYRVEYKLTLSAPTWSTLTDVTANSTQSSITDDASAGSQKLYRIELLNP